MNKRTSNLGAKWSVVDLTHVPKPVVDRISIFEVQASESTLQGIDITNSLNFQYLNRGWGLSLH